MSNLIIFLKTKVVFLHETWAKKDQSPLKKGFFQKQWFCALVNFRSFLDEKTTKNRKVAVKKGKNANFESLSNVYLNSKFQVALMFDGWRNREQTHYFWICVWKKKTPENAPQKLKFSGFLYVQFFGMKIVFVSKFHSPRCSTRKSHTKI